MKFIKILSLNVRVLCNHVKRKAFFLYLKNQKADFYCLQNGVGKILFSHGTKQSKGTCILQRPNSLFSLDHLSIDPNGRSVIAKSKLGDKDFFLASVYVLCDSQQQTLLPRIPVQILSLKQTRSEL